VDGNNVNIFVVLKNRLFSSLSWFLYHQIFNFFFFFKWSLWSGSQVM